MKFRKTDLQLYVTVQVVRVRAMSLNDLDRSGRMGQTSGQT